MKTYQTRLRFIGVLTATAVATLVLMQLGCEKMKFWQKSPQPMASGAGVPASEGTVRATKGDNGNTNLAVRVKHLAPAYKVQPDATVYVVWLQQPDQPKQNIGGLVLDKNLEGSLDTVTPFRRFTVMVTPEASGTVEQPTHDSVFTAQVDRSE